MALEKLFVYLDSESKELVSEVAHRLKLSESGLVRALALPKVRAIAEALQKGVKPGAIRAKLLGEG